MNTTTAGMARSYRSAAGSATRRAERHAATAASLYAQAADERARAAWLTQHPSVWRPEIGYTPATVEATAASLAVAADSMLHSSFGATGRAADCRRLAASYREMAAR